MEPWRVCRPVVAESYNFDEEQDPDSHQSENEGSVVMCRNLLCTSTLVQ
jgi:hypothetical protein